VSASNQQKGFGFDTGSLLACLVRLQHVLDRFCDFFCPDWSVLLSIILSVSPDRLSGWTSKGMPCFSNHPGISQLPDRIARLLRRSPTGMFAM
jgi:hypothetical protein